MKKIFLSTVAASMLLFGAYDSPGTDYDKALVSDYTEESALETLDTVNMILSFIDDSKAEQFINKGPYKALVKDDEDGGGESSGSGTSTKVEKLLPMTLDVTRAIPTADEPNPPMKVKFWLDEPDGPNDQSMRVVGYINVTHSVDNEYPLGQMDMTYKGYSVNADGSTNEAVSMMKGKLSLDKARGSDAVPGRADIKFVEEEQSSPVSPAMTVLLNMTYDVNVDTNGDGKVDSSDTQGAGVAYVKSYNWESWPPSPKSFEISFGADSYKIQEVDANSQVQRDDPATGDSLTAYALAGTPICKSKTEFTKKVYEYGLFNAVSGARYNINAGLPIKKADGSNGYIGYWGLWSEGDSIVAGDTVTDMNDENTYTVNQTLGKLIKYTKTSTTMEKLGGSKIYFWGGSSNYVIHWDKDTQDFVLDGIQSCNDNGCQVTPATGVALASLITDWSRGWCESIQADIPINPNLTNNSVVAYYSQETVIPSQDLTLVNFGHEIINPDMNLSSGANYITESIEANATNGVIGNVYTYSSANGVLVDNNRANKPVIMPADTNVSVLANPGSHPWWEWGANMGPLLLANTPAVTNGTYDASNFWDVTQNEDTYYMWETGIQTWNKTTYLTDSNGAVVSFDSPVEISYTHSTANDINADSSHDGEMFVLHYDGNNLGLPWNFDEEAEAWMPVINVKSGTSVKVGNNDYVIKAISMGSMPNEIATCSGVLNPSKDVDSNFVPLDDSFGTGSLLQLDTSVIGTGGSVGTTPPASVSVAVRQGECLFDGCAVE